jgi:CspA family cold shock protein
MNFRDTLVTCQECGTQFIFTVEKQRELADKGLEVKIPELCDACTQRVKYGGKHHGRIKWFSAEKGYGFIVQDSGGEIFMHRQGIPLTEEGTLPPLEEGQDVLYEVIDTSKGPQAVQVTAYKG